MFLRHNLKYWSERKGKKIKYKRLLGLWCFSCFLWLLLSLSGVLLSLSGVGLVGGSGVSFCGVSLKGSYCLCLLFALASLMNTHYRLDVLLKPCCLALLYTCIRYGSFSNKFLWTTTGVVGQVGLRAFRLQYFNFEPRGGLNMQTPKTRCVFVICLACLNFGHLFFWISIAACEAISVWWNFSCFIS